MPSNPPPDDPAILLFTSESTGTPKGVVLAQRTPVNHARDGRRFMELGPDDRAAVLLPLSFGGGLDALAMSLLRDDVALGCTAPHHHQATRLAVRRRRHHRALHAVTAPFVAGRAGRRRLAAPAVDLRRARASHGRRTRAEHGPCAGHFLLLVRRIRGRQPRLQSLSTGSRGHRRCDTGFEWFPNVQTDPVYNSYSNVQYVPSAQVPGIPQDYPTGGGLTDLRVRCDRIPQFRNTGCVNPSNYPTLTTMVYEPHVADNIRAGQAAGQPGAPGGTPLIRTTAAQGDINRGLACSAARTAALPPPPSDMVQPTCDEYPFASSEQGGATATIAWVPKAENDNQGTSIGDFQRAYRVVPTDRFYVQV